MRPFALAGLVAIAGLAVLVAVVVVPDSDGGEGDRVPTQPPQARDDVRFEGGELGGTIYLLAGQDRLNADLYRVSGGLGRVERLTRAGRVSDVAAHDDVVVLSNARGSGSDRLELANLSGGDALPGELLDPNGQGPDFSPSGKLLYAVVQYTNGGGDAGDKVYVTEPRPGAAKRVLYDSRRAVSALWGPDERLAVLSPGHRAVVLDPGRPGRSSVDPGLGRLEAFLPSNQGTMLFYGPGKRLAVVPPDGQPRRFESEWDPIGWSPDGRALLATRGYRLGLMSPEDGSVEEVGRTSGGKVFQAEWVAKGDVSSGSEP
jgi:hypothetical protein